MTTKDHFLDLIKEESWENMEAVSSFLKPAIDITATPSDTALSIGTSKFGGIPDLPKDIDWPVNNGEPMAFLAQINLEATTEFDTESLLPTSGLLYFFMGDPSEYPIAHSVLFAPAETISKGTYPDTLNENYKFGELSMEFKPMYTFPFRESLEFESLSAQDQESYDALDDAIFSYENHQMLGHTSPMQGDVALEWAANRLGLDDSEILEVDQRLIDQKRKTFINLFQFFSEDSIPELYEHFYLYGMGYFGIEAQDLKEHKFHKALLAFQV